MFKYPQKPAPSPAGGSPFADADVPDEWAAPVQQPVASAPVGGGYFGAEESSASPFEVGSADSMPATTTRNVLNYDVSVVGTLRFTDDLLVDGSVEGEITSDGELTVGANASIQAGEKNKVAVRTQSAIIHGKVVGDIVVSDRVVLEEILSRLAIMRGQLEQWLVQSSWQSMPSAMWGVISFITSLKNRSSWFCFFITHRPTPGRADRSPLSTEPLNEEFWW